MDHHHPEDPGNQQVDVDHRIYPALIRAVVGTSRRFIPAEVAVHLHPEWAVASECPAWVEAVCLCLAWEVCLVVCLEWAAWVQDKLNQVDSLVVVKNITVARQVLEAVVTCLCPTAVVETPAVEWDRVITASQHGWSWRFR